MKSSPRAVWFVSLLIAGLGMMGCGEKDAPLSPETESSGSNVTGTLTLAPLCQRR